MNETCMGVKISTEEEAIARGNYFEVSCEGMEKDRTVVGWTNQPDGGALVRLVHAHPTWADPQVRDVRSERERVDVLG